MEDIPWFVWFVGGIGVVALVAGYGFALGSKTGDGLRELGWLGVGVLVTVAGVDVAQRRARAAQWAPVVGDLRQEARRLAVLLASTLWQDATWSGAALSLFSRSLGLTSDQSVEDDLRAANDELNELWQRLAAAQALYGTEGDIDQEAWAALEDHVVHVPSNALTPEIAARGARLVALLDELVAADVGDAAALARERLTLRRDLDVYLSSRAGAPDHSILVLLSDVPVEERAELVVTLDLAMRVALHGSGLVECLARVEALLRG